MAHLSATVAHALAGGAYGPGELQFAVARQQGDRGYVYMSVGRMLIALGVFLVVLGLLFTVGAKLPFRLGHLPGDIYVHGKHTTFYFPIVTCLLLSVLLSLVLWLFRR